MELGRQPDADLSQHREAMGWRVDPVARRYRPDVALARLKRLILATGCGRLASEADRLPCGCGLVCLRGRGKPWRKGGVTLADCEACPDRPPG